MSDYDPMFRSCVTHVPLLIVWPGRIAGGQRFSQPVSMVDVLPTVLDLVDLPMPEIMQGQSLVPLLLGEEGWEPRPVILDGAPWTAPWSSNRSSRRKKTKGPSSGHPTDRRSSSTRTRARKGPCGPWRLATPKGSRRSS